MTTVELVYLVGYSVVGPKELRYSSPVWPLLCALAAVGIDVLARVQPRPRLGVAAAAVAGVAALLARARLRPRRVPPPAQRHYNYAIELGRDGSAALVPLGFFDCAPDASYRWNAN